MSIEAVLAGTLPWHIECGDNLEVMRRMPDGCCALTLTSPPYTQARTYSINFAHDGQAWVDWMAERVVEMCRVTAGLVCINMAGQVRDHCYQPVVEWLVADLTRHHALVCGPAPYVYFRFGIPGSGGRHYHRRDWEPIYAFARPEHLPLAWSDNTSMGHTPKWGPGGGMSNRLKSGQRVGKFGAGGHKSNGRIPSGRKVKPSNSSLAQDVVVGQPGPGMFGPTDSHQGPQAAPDGSTRKRPRKVSSGVDGSVVQGQESYDPPAIANPGNVLRAHYDAEEVRQLLEDLITHQIEPGDVVRTLAGGGNIGSKLAHENEAPFAERLAEFFVRSFCPPGGITLDPFSGSGTTAAVAIRHGRRAIGIDVRQSQADLGRRRVSGETPPLFS